MNTYTMRYRPAGFASLPKVNWSYTEAPRDLAHIRTDIPASRYQFGVFQTDRALTADELKHYEIMPV